MTERILPFLVHFVTQVIGSLGYAGIVALWASNPPASRSRPKSSCPSPGTWSTPATSAFLGCHRRRHRLQSRLLVAYWVGAAGGRPLVLRYGRWVLMSPTTSTA